MPNISQQVETLRSLLVDRYTSFDADLLEFDSADDELEVAPGDVRLVRDKLRPKLFPYQSELSRAFVDLVNHRRDGLIALPTGAGKTRTAVNAILASLVDLEVRRVIWLAPSTELVDQAASTFSNLWVEFGSAPDIDVDRTLSSFSSGRNSVLFTTPQAIYSASKRGKLNASGVQIVVFDEAHQLGARTFLDSVDAIRAQSPDAVLVGLSATPGRVDPRETDELVDYFGGNLVVSPSLSPNPVKTLQRFGVLAQLKFRDVPKNKSDNEATRITTTLKLLEKLHESGSRVMVFSESVAGAIVVAELARASSIPANAVYGELSEGERRRRIAQFGAGTVSVLTNQRLLATGYDCPAITDLVLIGKIGSPILFEQVIGRGARGPLTGGSRVTRIWQFDDHLKIHGLPNSYYRYVDFDWKKSN